MNPDMWLNIGVTILFSVIKNPLSKGQYKKISLKVYQTIKAAFAGDPDFQ